MSTLDEIKKTTLLTEVENEISAVINSVEFIGWSSECRKSWAKSILALIQNDGLDVKQTCLAVLDHIAKEGR